MPNAFRSLTLAAALATGTALAASAATVSFTSSLATSSVLTAYETAGGTTTLPSDGSWSTTPQIETADLVSGHYRSPFYDGSGTPYWVIGSNTTTGSTSSPVTLSFSNTHGLFSMLWGSPDSYNRLDFYNNGTLVGSIAGSDIPATGSGAYVVSAYGFQYDQVKFYDNNNTSGATDVPAFEFASISDVPVPATGFLLLGGIGAFGALRRRKKKATA